MAELCIRSSTFKPQASLIYNYFTHFSRFILSHPLYFSYLIFFSPCLLKFLSFIFPLFITTSFLLLLLGLAHNNSASTLFEPRQNFLLSTFHVIQQSLLDKLGFESQELCPNLEECEAYKLVFVFDTPTSDMVEHPTGEYLLHSFDDKEVVVNISAIVGVKPASEVHQTTSSNSRFVEEKRLQDFFEVLEDFDDNVVEKMVDPISTKSIEVVEEHVDESKIRKTVDPIITKSIKVVEENVDESKVRKGSEAKDVNIIGGNNGGEHTRRVMSLAKPFYGDATIDSGEYTSNLGSYNRSLRKEKEWKRTLACKLFEERHNAVVEGDERIDALWERHESDELSKSMRMAPDTNKKKNMKTSTILNNRG